MKLLKLFFLFLLTNTATSFAYEAPAYYANGSHFSIDGYDFIEDSLLFPIVTGKLYDVAEEGEEQLAGGGFRKLIRITNAETQESQVFKTRIINTSNYAIIAEAKETERKITQEYMFGGGDFSGYWYTLLTIKYDITLEDGGKLDFEYFSQRIQNNNNIILSAGDQIKILKQKRRGWNGDDFSNYNYTIKVFHDTKEIGTFIVTGMERRDHMHGHRDNLYVVNQLSPTFPLCITFYGVEGWWEFANLFERDAYYPYPGDQFEILSQVDSETILLKPYNSDAQVKFIHRH